MASSYDPNKKVFNQEVELLHDLEPKLQHGGKCDVWEAGSGQWFAKFKKGAIVSSRKHSSSIEW